MIRLNDLMEVKKRKQPFQPFIDENIVLLNIENIVSNTVVV